MYFDGSWKQAEQPPAPRTLAFKTSTPAQKSPPLRTSPARPAMPESRYVGAFGVGAWATRSGTGLVRHGENVRVERQKIQPPPPKKGAKGKAGAAHPPRNSAFNRRTDIIMRFTNARGDEVGRLPRETAAWVSTLIDQNICRFDGVCVFVPDRVRVNDTVYLQLRCSFLRRCFEAGGFRPLESNRSTGIFEAKESDEEKDLRLRQVALIKLFEEINLQPSKTNETTARHKRQGLLQAADAAEQHDKAAAKREPGDEPSTPPSDEPEDGEELEQDQLDTLYKKAQSFDFDTPAAEPPSTFVMDLRHYQKQALHWMMAKEKDEQSTEEASMHPLWEEYAWPTKDVEDRDLPAVAGQERFYVNPYSGELSLDFPVQEQNCLGGVLADEMGLGKTIEMLSLMQAHRSDVAVDAAAPADVNGLPRLPKASSSVEPAPCTTLVVAPMSLLAQWQSEAEKASAAGSMRTLVYYGSDKSANLQTLCCEANAASAPHLVITSYGVVLSEFNQVAGAHRGNRGSHGGLFSLDFFRVILDEAHHIKNRQSKTAKACYELDARHRWVLTGTPIVNRLEDLFSLVHFLRVEPWSNFSFWKTFITVPFESKDFIRALDVVQTVLEPLVLRRTKDDAHAGRGQALVPLPSQAPLLVVPRLQLSAAGAGGVRAHCAARAQAHLCTPPSEAGTLLKSLHHHLCPDSAPTAVVLPPAADPQRGARSTAATMLARRRAQPEQTRPTPTASPTTPTCRR